MKTLTALEYANRAVSTDMGRYNLNAAWRQDTRLCATDGHRLHYVRGLTETPVVSYIDGRDCQPPHIDQIIKELPEVTCVITPNKETLKRLSVICKLKERKSFYGPTCILSANQHGIRVSGTSDFPVSWSMQLVGHTPIPSVNTLRIGLQLPYLVDVLIEDVPCQIRVTADRSQIYVTYAKHAYKEYTALIMPVRIADLE